VYTTTGNTLTASAATALRQNAVLPAIDRSISRTVLNGLRVYDGTLAFLGTLPATTVAVAVKPNGSRAFAYDPSLGGIVTY
jgi:hypothetical protein